MDESGPDTTKLIEAEIDVLMRRLVEIHPNAIAMMQEMIEGLRAEAEERVLN